MCRCDMGWVLLSALWLCRRGFVLRVLVSTCECGHGSAALLGCASSSCHAATQGCALLWVEVAAPAPRVTLGWETWQAPPGLQATDFALAQLEERQYKTIELSE